MKKTIFIVIVILLIVHFNAYFKNKADYQKAFNGCLEGEKKIMNYLKGGCNTTVSTLIGCKKLSDVEAFLSECHAKGGCYESCGSGCGLPKPTITILGLDYYFKPSICVQMCTMGCLPHP
jgi:hypothetical protein